MVTDIAVCAFTVILFICLIFVITDNKGDGKND